MQSGAEGNAAHAGFTRKSLTACKWRPELSDRMYIPRILCLLDMAKRQSIWVLPFSLKGILETSAVIVP